MNLLSLFKPKPTTRPSAKPLMFQNTLSGEKEEFRPLRKEEVRMYNCGPTVYDTQHIGNLRPYVFTDVLRRVLEYNGYRVRQVINITDVGHLTGDNEGDADVGEDKLEKAAEAKKRKVKDIAREVTKEFMKDLERLGVNTKVIAFPKATDHIADQIAFVKTLEEKGYTYKTSDGIYFDTSQFNNYGKLGTIDIKGIQEGARIGIKAEKKHPTDFALWKFSHPAQQAGPGAQNNARLRQGFGGQAEHTRKNAEGEIQRASASSPRQSAVAKRQQEWNSPWGVGFPGWHIECSAMAMSELGKQIDIHTGGIDHIPIHHNNEIAQTESVTGKTFANYWLHNAFITVEGQKIAKSIGNTIYLRNIIDKGFSPLSLRYWFLTGHYRSPMNFTWEALEGAETTLFRIYKHFTEKLGSKNGDVDKRYQERFHKMTNDNLDTPAALALVWELVKDETIRKEDKRATILNFDRVLGLGLARNKRDIQKILSLKVISLKDLPADVQTLVEKREEKREQHDWEKADLLREQVREKGYKIEDTEKGPEVSKLST